MNALRILACNHYYVKNESYEILLFCFAAILLFYCLCSSAGRPGIGGLFCQAGFGSADGECENGRDLHTEGEIPRLDQAVWE
jgi:hypothetical protein